MRPAGKIRLGKMPNANLEGPRSTFLWLKGGRVEKKKKSAQQGVQGVEIGLRVAYALANSRGPMALRQLAEDTGLAPSKLHRYLVSLCRSNLVEQKPGDGRYDLSKGAIRLGLAALSRLDEFRAADEIIQALSDETGLAVTVMTWGSHGPTVVRRIQPIQPIIATTRVGTLISVVNSASGRVFAAFLPPEIVGPVVAAEFASPRHPTSMGRPIDRAAFDKIVADVRRKRIARVRSDFLTGFDAIAVPVFDHEGQIVMTIALIGPTRIIDLTLDAPQARALIAAGRRLSERLGYRDDREDD